MAVSPSADKFVYITGCDTGFGSILARRLDKMGFGVIAGMYLEESIAKIKSECSARMNAVRVDVSNEDSVNKAAKEIEEILRQKGGVLHSIVNNAGILVQPGPVEWTPTEAYHKMFNVNVMGTVMTTKSLLPLIRKSQGRIVNVASIAGRIGLPSEPAYCMSKYGVEGYSNVLRMDMYNWGVTVHIVEPGVFKATGLYQRFATGLDDLWGKLSPSLKEEYGEAYYKNMRKGMVNALSKGNANSGIVVDAMIEAITSAKPKYRYKVGIDSKYLISFFEKTHESVSDYVVAQLWKKSDAAAAKEGAVKTAHGRYHKAWTRFIIVSLLALYVIRKLRK